jgi:hypothetical protein
MYISGKIKILDGKLLCLRAIARRMTNLGHPVTHASLSLIFSGKKNPSYPMFLSLARTLGLSLDEMADLIERVRAGQYRTVGT